MKKNYQMHKFKLSDKTKDYLIQVVLIVGSVLLALWLDQLMADRMDNKKKEVAINNIITEIEKNLEEVKSVSHYHEKMGKGLSMYIDSIDFDHVEENAMTIISPFMKYGLQVASIQETAWDMATETESVSSFEYEMAYDMTRLYDLQQRGVLSTTSKIMDFLTDPSLFRKEEREEVVMVFTFAMRELASQEKYLEEKYQEFLEKYQG